MLIYNKPEPNPLKAMMNLKNKGKALEELAQMHARALSLSRELMEQIDSINKYLGENFPEFHAGIPKSRKKNDLVTDEIILKRLNKLIEKEELYLPSKSKLIKDIAKDLDITQKRLKKAFECRPRYNNLHKLLCHHRIKAACKMIDEHPNFSIEAISLECGFTSRKSFYRWFLMEMGCTPLEYQARDKKDE